MSPLAHTALTFESRRLKEDAAHSHICRDSGSSARSCGSATRGNASDDETERIHSTHSTPVCDLQIASSSACRINPCCALGSMLDRSMTAATSVPLPSALHACVRAALTKRSALQWRCAPLASLCQRTSNRICVRRRLKTAAVTTTQGHQFSSRRCILCALCSRIVFGQPVVSADE